VEVLSQVMGKLINDIKLTLFVLNGISAVTGFCELFFMVDLRLLSAW